MQTPIQIRLPSLCQSSVMMEAIGLTISHGYSMLWERKVYEDMLTVSAPLSFPMTNRVAMLADGKTMATKEQLEQKESKIIEFKKMGYLAHHILVSTTSTHLAMKIKGFSTAKDMWNTITDDAMSKSTLYLLDAKD
jgi:hypothetical protein